MKNVILFLSFLIIPQIYYAQEAKKNEEEFKIAALPYYSYGKGLGMTSPDSLFQLNIRFRMQNRVTYFQNDHESNTYEAQIRRLRLRLDGYVGDPRFQYALQLSFAPGDVGDLEDGENLNIIRDAVITYKPNKHWSFLFGQTKLPGNRQRVNSSGSLQLTDRSINNARFNIDRDFGLQAYYLHEEKELFSYNIKTAISSGKGRNWDQKDNHFALTGKIELFPWGTFTHGGEYFEGDIKRESKPKLMLSAVWHKNYSATLDKGQQGAELFEPRDLQSIFVDAIAKYNGWAGMISYMRRSTDRPITHSTSDENTQLSQMAAVGHGLDYQLSYTFLNHYELIGRYSVQKVPTSLYQLNTPNIQQYSLGITKYIWEHAFKIQGEVTYDKSQYINGLTNNNLYFRFQVEIGI